MSVNEQEAVVRRWFDEVWNRKHLDAIDELLAPAAIDHGLADVGHGRGAHRYYAQQFLQAFPDLFVTIDELHSEGDVVVVRGTHRATHKGAWAGIKATGKKIELPWSSRIRVEDGRIAEAWTHLDPQEFLRQINAAPPEDEQKAS